jgi:hypothetical protein
MSRLPLRFEAKYNVRPSGEIAGHPSSAAVFKVGSVPGNADSTLSGADHVL